MPVREGNQRGFAICLEASVCVSERQIAVKKEEHIIIVHILIVSIHLQMTWKLQGMELQKVENPNLHTRVLESYYQRCPI